MTIKKLFFALLILSLVLVSGCVGFPYYGHMGSWGHMMDYWYYGGFMWLFILIAAGVVIYLLIRTSSLKDKRDSTSETPLDILKKRYAKGEIDKDEFEQKKKDLGS